jgi:hypothetical protein
MNIDGIKLRGSYFKNDVPTKNVDIFNWIAERFTYHGILWSESGRACVKDVDDEYREIGLNHIKSIVRRDYIEAHGPTRAIDKIIDDVMTFNFEQFRSIDKEKCIMRTVTGRINS